MGIIGGGFVGSAYARVFQQYTDVRVFDLERTRRTHSLPDVVKQDVLFVCLPTPMRPDGTVETSIVRDALEHIRANSAEWKPVILKSTIPPKDLWDLHLEFHQEIYLVFSPEFLTERTAEYDLQQSTRFIFGVNSQELGLRPQRPQAREMIELLFEQRFPNVSQHWVPFATASLVKYFTNMFFATKISLMNEFSAVAAAWNQSGQEVINLMMLDPRIGKSHFLVPGHDGELGFGGHCFIKDAMGYMHLAKDGHVDPEMAQAAWRTNVTYRGAEVLARELTRMVGRAAVEPFTPEDVRGLEEQFQEKE